MTNDPGTLKENVRRQYGAIARQAKATNASSCCGAGGCSTEVYNIMTDDYTGLAGYAPDADLGLGCGLPTQFAGIRPGDTVLDLGSGAGNDCFVARHETGADGRVIGVDFTPEMVAKARENAGKLGFQNVEFRQGDIEELPVSDGMIDVVVSNCVLNLVPDKRKAFSEVMRVLRPGGHFSISDVVLVGELPEAIREAAEMYAGCVSGALQDREGCFQRAHGGTLFLDEVGNLSPENQMRLLRALQERVVQRLGSGTTEAVDVRLIAATNEELHRSDRGGFREDLFHRLNEFSIHLPPLRQRPEDILHYAEHFLGLARERLGRQVDGIDTEAAALLKRQPWPGNLRELNNVIKRAVLVCTGDRITVRDLPAELALAPANNGTSKAPDGDLKEVARQAERETIMDALRQNAYNKTRTAAMLNIDRKTLYNKLKAFGIEG